MGDAVASSLWPVGWEENRRAQARDALRAGAAERLAWLEEMIDFWCRAREAQREAATDTER